MCKLWVREDSNTEKKLTPAIRLENNLEKCVLKVKNFGISEVKGWHGSNRTT